MLEQLIDNKFMPIVVVDIKRCKAIVASLIRIHPVMLHEFLTGQPLHTLCPLKPTNNAGGVVFADFDFLAARVAIWAPVWTLVMSFWHP